MDRIGSDDNHIRRRGPRPTDPEVLRARGAYRKHPDRDPGKAAPKALKPRIRPFASIAKRYAEDVVAGAVPACRWTRLAAERHLRDLDRQAEPGFEFRLNALEAGRRCARIESFPHTKGRWAKRGELLRLAPWQVFIVASIFGWLRKADGKRRFREAYVRVAKKNGKSLLAAAIGNTMLFDDGEHGAEVYCGATSEKQAWEVFGPARLMMQRSPELCEEHGVEVWAKALVRPEDNSRFWPVIGRPGHGLSPSCAIIDEFHEHDTPEQIDTMATGMGAREHPLLLVITTAGTNLASPCYEKDREAQRVLEGTLLREDLFTILYGIDEPDEARGVAGDNWTDHAVLAKANPNIGVSISREFLEAQQRAAVQNVAYQNRFKTMHLDIWCGASVAGLNMADWKAAADPSLRLEAFLGERCWLALDLASKIDVCSVAKLFRRVVKGLVHWYAFGTHRLPEDAVGEDGQSVNRDAYERWARKGHLVLTDGAEIDFREVRDEVMAEKSRFQVVEIVYDPWRATHLSHELTAAGATVVEFPDQGGRHMAHGFDELGAALRAGRFHHDGNEVLEWMASNVMAKSIAKGLVVPAKEKRTAKIDGIVALCMALDRASPGPTPPSVYETRGVIAL